MISTYKDYDTNTHTYPITAGTVEPDINFTGICIPSSITCRTGCKEVVGLGSNIKDQQKVYHHYEPHKLINMEHISTRTVVTYTEACEHFKTEIEQGIITKGSIACVLGLYRSKDKLYKIRLDDPRFKDYLIQQTPIKITYDTNTHTDTTATGVVEPDINR